MHSPDFAQTLSVMGELIIAQDHLIASQQRVEEIITSSPALYPLAGDVKIDIETARRRHQRSKAIQQPAGSQTMTEQQEQLTQAIEGAIIGIAAASEHQEITSSQIYALLTNLFSQLKTTLN